MRQDIILEYATFTLHAADFVLADFVHNISCCMSVHSQSDFVNQILRIALLELDGKDTRLTCIRGCCLNSGGGRLAADNTGEQARTAVV